MTQHFKNIYSFVLVYSALTRMQARYFLIASFCFSCYNPSLGQYLIQGTVDSSFNFNYANLDMLNHWDDLHSVSDQMTIKSVPINKDGQFSIRGNELPVEDGFYRIRYSKLEREVSIRTINHNYINFCFSNDDTIKIVDYNFIPNNESNEKLLPIIELHRNFLLQMEQAENEVNKELLSTKYIKNCKAFIEKSDDVLCNLYCLQSTNLLIEAAPSLFKKVQAELHDPKIRDCYVNSIDPVIQAYEFKNLKKSNNNWRTGLIISGMLNLLLLGLLLRNRKKKKGIKETPRIDSLTNKESEILALIVGKKTNKEIATACFISETTVKTHINNIYRKLQVKSRKEAINIYLEHKSTGV